MYSIAFTVAPFCLLCIHYIVRSVISGSIDSLLKNISNPEVITFLQELETFGGTDQDLNLVPGKFYCPKGFCLGFLKFKNFVSGVAAVNISN